MKHFIPRFRFNLLWFLFVALGLCFFSACGGSGSDDEGDDGDSSEDISTSEAEDTAGAALETTMYVLTEVLSGEEASLSAPTGLVRSRPPMREMTITETSSCSGVAPSPVSGGSSFTIYGTDLSSGGSGSCTVSIEDLSEAGMSTIYAVLSCSDFNGAEVTNYVSLDGSIGIAISDYSSSYSNEVSIRAAVGTNDFLMGFIQDGSTRLCEIKMHIIEIVTVTVGESSASATTEYDGCISVCDAPFELSGSDTETYTFE